ncbi:hypothetical protein ACEPAG_8346 [Sanghuangporus baumii]
MTWRVKVQDLRTQLSRERDTARQISLQKDIEAQELRTKLDHSVENLPKARESLVEAETSRKHLREPVDELVKQVQMNEERIAILERRTDTSRPPTGEDGSEQELKVEVAVPRAAMNAAEVDLASARGRTEVLEEKLSSVQDEITRLSTQNGDFLQRLEKEHEVFTQDRKMLEDTVIDITNAEMGSRTGQSSHENEIRERMQHAKAAEEKYSRELSLMPSRSRS